MTDIVLAIGDDWEGLYVDGRLETEGHGIRARDLAEALIIRPALKSFVSKEVNYRWLCDRGDLPGHINEVNWA